MWLYFNEYSGKAYFRYKIGGRSIKHPGIYIGADQNGVQYFAHNHVQYGRPVLVTMDEFTAGSEIYPYKEYATTPMATVIERALNGILKSEQYTLATFNCQVYVNESINNERKSEAVDNSVFGLLLIGCLALFSATDSGE